MQGRKKYSDYALSSEKVMVAELEASMKPAVREAMQPQELSFKIFTILCLYKNYVY